MRSRTVRNVLVGLGILCGSYLAAAFMNAATISQPRLTAVFPRGPVVIVTEPPTEVSEPVTTRTAPEPPRNLAL